MIDTYENKCSKDAISFYFIDVEKKVIIDALNMVNQSGKCFIQAVNSKQSVFLLEREH